MDEEVRHDVIRVYEFGIDKSKTCTMVWNQDS